MRSYSSLPSLSQVNGMHCACYVKLTVRLLSFRAYGVASTIVRGPKGMVWVVTDGSSPEGWEVIRNGCTEKRARRAEGAGRARSVRAPSGRARCAASDRADVGTRRHAVGPHLWGVRRDDCNG